MSSEPVDLPFSIAIARGHVARELVLQVEAKLDAPELAPDAMVRAFAENLDIGFFGRAAGSPPASVPFARREDSPKARRYAIGLSLPPTRRSAIVALVRIFDQMRDALEVTRLDIASAVATKSPLRSESLADLSKHADPLPDDAPFDLDIALAEHGSFSASARFEQPLTKPTKKRLARLSRAFGWLVEQGAFPGETSLAGSTGWFVEAVDPLPDEWCLRLEGFGAQPEAVAPLVEAFVALHSETPLIELVIR